MRVFEKIEEIDRIENNQQWENNGGVLYQMWLNSAKDVNYTLRVISTCWCYLTDIEYSLSMGENIYHDYKNVLMKITLYGLENFKEDPKFNSIVGYMISLFPYLFCETNRDEEYFSWERKGKELIHQSFLADTQDYVIKVLYYISINDKGNYISSTKVITQKNLLPKLFPSNSLIENYFREIFSF